MKDSHVTLRLSPDLARALARWADERGLSRSHVVREAVATYLTTPSAPPTPDLTGAELAAAWTRLPRLDPAEARAFAEDVAEARNALPAPSPWE